MSQPPLARSQSPSLSTPHDPAKHFGHGCHPCPPSSMDSFSQSLTISGSPPGTSQAMAPTHRQKHRLMVPIHLAICFLQAVVAPIHHVDILLLEVAPIHLHVILLQVVAPTHHHGILMTVLFACHEFHNVPDFVGSI